MHMHSWPSTTAWRHPLGCKLWTTKAVSVHKPGYSTPQQSAGADRAGCWGPTVVLCVVGHDDLRVRLCAQRAALQQRPSKVHAAAVHVQARIHVVQRVHNDVQAAPESVVKDVLRTLAHLCLSGSGRCTAGGFFSNHPEAVWLLGVSSASLAGRLMLNIECPRRHSCACSRTSESGETRFCSARIRNAGLMASAAFAAAVDFALHSSSSGTLDIKRRKH